MGKPKLQELLDQYLAQEEMYHFEGESGLENLNEVASVLGYKGHNFANGSPLETFICDNPGVQQAIINWIGEQKIPEWRDEITSQLNDEDEDEDP